MAEPTVQVPVSLNTEALRRVARNEGLWEPEAALVEAAADEIDRLRALLSQPTPTAEDAWEKAAQIAERDSTGVTLVNLNQFPVVQATGFRIAFNIRAEAQKQNGPATAEILRSQGPHPKVNVLGRNEAIVPAKPPRIEDMAPGTTFRFGKSDTVWTLYYNAMFENFYVVSPDGSVWQAEDIDPATIRDVTPPRDAA